MVLSRQRPGSWPGIHAKIFGGGYEVMPRPKRTLIIHAKAVARAFERLSGNRANLRGLQCR
jgi:hypothetical protein